MENEDLSSKCENLMNIVVESRKRFGKTCVDYDQKILLVEKKLLNLQIETTSNYRFKPKTTVSSQEPESSKDMDDFSVEIVDKQKRIDDLIKKLQNTHEVLAQLDSDGVGKKLRFPLTAEAILSRAKAKEM
ncbi:unnamed protein product [Arctia plantaginis]|uniref:Uncharacterized protein n=1 Tax=Arctia plantaginis TaxID=874455 RepID=A0A8S0YSD4_ARCPL|nr:unnamed protein product [Arctia plantaginis]